MGSAAILARIRALEKKLEEVRKEIKCCNELLGELLIVRDDVSSAIHNLKNMLNYLSLGLRINGKTYGEEQLNPRITSLSNFESATNAAIAAVQKRLGLLEEEEQQLVHRIAMLWAEYHAAVAAERAAAEAAAAAAAAAASSRKK